MLPITMRSRSAHISRLKRELEAEGYTSVRIFLVDGQLRLHGWVSCFRDKRAVESRAARLGLKVVNCLRVAPATHQPTLLDAAM